MHEYNLNKMNRKELLELLLQQSSENETMKEQIKALEEKTLAVQRDCEKKLADRRIEISRVGTMAEAAMRLNKIFENADLAAKQYLENIQRYGENAESSAKAIKEEANREAAAIIAAAKSEAEKTKTSARVSVKSALEQAKKEAESIITDAQTQASRIRLEARQYQKNEKEKMEELYSIYKGLQSFLGALEDKAL